MMVGSPFNDLAGPRAGAVISKDLQAQVFKAAVTKGMLREDGTQVSDVGNLREREREKKDMISVGNILQLWPIMALELISHIELQHKFEKKMLKNYL